MLMVDKFLIVFNCFFLNYEKTKFDVKRDFIIIIFARYF
jgi:hypothetical protein